MSTTTLGARFAKLHSTKQTDNNRQSNKPRQSQFTRNNKPNNKAANAVTESKNKRADKFAQARGQPQTNNKKTGNKTNTNVKGKATGQYLPAHTHL
jgi:hypothetical protein